MRRLPLAGLLCIWACSQPTAREMAEGALAPARGDTAVVNAAAALQRGQPWQASRILEPLLRDSAQRTPDRVLLAARAAAEWGGWVQVDRHLGRESWLDSRFEGLGRELLARAAMARRDDTVALRHARLAVDAATSRHERGTRTVLLARAYDRVDSLERAAAAYAEAAALLPDVSDWLRLRAAAVTADSATRATHYALVRTSEAKARVPWVEAQMRERIRDFAGAARAYEALGARVSALRLRLTASLVSGDTLAKDAIRRELFDLVGTKPGSNEARLAVEIIDSTLTPLTPTEELAVARSAAASGPAARAIEGFERAASAGDLTGNDRYTYASLLASVGRHRDAVVQFAKVTPTPRLAGKVAYERARALLRSGNASKARDELEAVVAQYPADTSAASAALYLLGDLAVDDGRDDEARALYRRVATQYPGSTLGPSVRFRAAILSFVKGDARRAAAELDTLSLERNAERMAAVYWSGRAWERAGDSAMARTRWADVIAKEPSSYYAMLAARRLQQSPWAPRAVADSSRADSGTVAALRRAELLREIGMDPEAQLETDGIIEAASRSVGGTLAAAHAFRELGLASRALRLATKALAAGAPRDTRLYRVLYPLGYESVLTREAARHQLDWALVAALIRQESSFDPRATSRVGARGLMQIMPAVGRQLAAAERYHLWDPALLYQPDVSLELGTKHLAGLLSGYRDVSHALAAYNAGSTRAKRWLERAGTDDPEVFIERIPYPETRDYVRIILRDREVYRRVHAGDSSQVSPSR